MSLPTILVQSHPSGACVARCLSCLRVGNRWSYIDLLGGEAGVLHVVDLAVDHLVMVHDTAVEDAERIAWQAVAA